MHRLVVALVLAFLLTSGCGSSGDQKSPSGSSPEASTAPAGYFEEADTTAINKAASAAQKAGAKAQDQKNYTKCDRAGSKGFDQWRACWHRLLDPFQAALNALAAEMKALTSQDLPAACKSSLGSAADTFEGFARQVAGLLGGIDSDKRAAQAKSMRTYDKTLRQIAAGYTKPFQDMTQVCYSPSDLESINATPKSSPTP